MARINVPMLVIQATDLADRADFVRHDPAVIKAAREAGSDFAQATRSTSVLINELRGAWLRSSAGRR